MFYILFKTVSTIASSNYLPLHPNRFVAVPICVIILAQYIINRDVSTKNTKWWLNKTLLEMINYAGRDQIGLEHRTLIRLKFLKLPQTNLHGCLAYIKGFLALFISKHLTTHPFINRLNC